MHVLLTALSQGSVHARTAAAAIRARTLLLLICTLDERPGK
jgi:hypothetical protein